MMTAAEGCCWAAAEDRSADPIRSSSFVVGVCLNAWGWEESDWHSWKRSEYRHRVRAETKEVGRSVGLVGRKKRKGKVRIGRIGEAKERGRRDGKSGSWQRGGRGGGGGRVLRFEQEENQSC
ncbi:unnamed protein product [Calypogeia fissa]